MDRTAKIEPEKPLSKRILLGVTGGIAAYKAAELCRALVKAGHTVEVAMTDAAQRFITPLTFQALSGEAVLTSQWAAGTHHGMDHIAAARRAALILVAPASADFLARLAHGHADDVLATLCLARTAPLAVAPAMNTAMWHAPATRRNIERLRADGVWILGPDAGELACGETGPGRMLDVPEILAALPGILGQGVLAGRRVLVTAGPTLEPIDPVRAITNLSSGKMGYAVARAAAEAGATVCLVSGPTCLPAPAGVRRIDVRSALDMRDAVLAEVADADVFIAVAAVADYRPAQAAPHKIKKTAGTLTLDLVRNPDILAEVAARDAPPLCVGFAAETGDLLAHGREKMARKKVPLLVANLAQDTLGQDDAALVLIDAAGEHPLARADKLTQARRLIRHIATLLP
jgi:phosphopantothenoylcysteine decarboxylase/phosphopantothenate--cysteine ligase